MTQTDLTYIEDRLDIYETVKKALDKYYSPFPDEIEELFHELARDYMEYFNSELECSLDEYLAENFFSDESFLTEDAKELGERILKLWG